ncbi:hypothetical protein BJG93_31745 (plasmid) [Paraburkholderia sprentiae WSM5005]|uniref:Uncharacterized protein n=1 Tax=Paraburkholderia sprentiae WSM5005 TaxID=754502 RepID=A0A1I9YUV7_9BURK|nr:hypothetical protein [Paraburkholderia sprentiae]APA90000.1 hypothetical protein BJG93_31745 [Paraburkholderia sprentiae WSM5005]
MIVMQFRRCTDRMSLRVAPLIRRATIIAARGSAENQPHDAQDRGGATTKTIAAVKRRLERSPATLIDATMIVNNVSRRIGETPI